MAVLKAEMASGFGAGFSGAGFGCCKKRRSGNRTKEFIHLPFY
jgi:hypothetical protein